MLLNEFLKPHRRIEEQDHRIDQLTAQLKEQAALIQKGNAQVEARQTCSASGQQSLKPHPPRNENSGISQSTVTLHRMAAFVSRV
jgi:hypothetical protein